MTEAKTALPEFAYTTLNGEPEQIIIIKRGEDGYYPFRRAASAEVAEAFVKRTNETLGVTPAQREAMVSGSMFGWHVPAADPDNYDAEGKPLTQRRRDQIAAARAKGEVRA